MTSDRALEPVTSTSTRRPGRSGAWSPIVRMHFYAGVFIAPFLVLAALTGLAYAFTPQLDQIVYGHELRVDRATGTPRPLADQIRAARAAHPEGTVATVIPPAGKKATTAVVLNVPALGENQRTVYVDPYTAEVRGALTTSFDSTPMTAWLSELHKSLHLGTTGRLYSELAASWLWVIAAGGVVMWLGRRRHYRGRAGTARALWPDRKARGVRRTRGRHATTGLWLTIGLLFLSASGLTWSEHAGKRFDKVQESLKSAAPTLSTTLPASGHANHGGAGTATAATDPDAADRMLARAREAGLTGPVKLSPPEQAGNAWQVAQNDNTWPVRKDKIAIDPSTGQVTARVKWADYPFLAKLSTLGIQAHMGRLFGLVNQLALATVAAGLLTVVFWAYYMWWQRRPTRTDRRAPLGTAPARGGWRHLPRPVLLLGIPAVLFVAWAVPLFGITFLAFLLVDLAIGAIRRRTPANTAPGR